MLIEFEKLDDVPDFYIDVLWQLSIRDNQDVYDVLSSKWSTDYTDKARQQFKDAWQNDNKELAARWCSGLARMCQDADFRDRLIKCMSSVVDGTRHFKMVFSKTEFFLMSGELIKRGGHLIKAQGIAIYNILAMHADNDTKECYPSHKLIAYYCGMTTTTVKKYLEMLREHNVICWDARITTYPDGSTEQTSNRYRLLDSRVWNLPNEVITQTWRKETNKKDK